MESVPDDVGALVALWGRLRNDVCLNFSLHQRWGFSYHFRALAGRGRSLTPLRYKNVAGLAPPWMLRIARSRRDLSIPPL